MLLSKTSKSLAMRLAREQFQSNVNTINFLTIRYRMFASKKI